MPELPEVQTTVNGLNKTVKGREIVSVETTYKSLLYKGSDNIKDPSFFKKFREILRQIIRRPFGFGIKQQMV